MKIKTLMLGWEFPPYISGGLGTACYGLTKAMGRLGMEVTFLLPRMGPVRLAGNPGAYLESGFPHVRLRAVPSSLLAYGRFGNPRSGRHAASGAGQHEEAAAYYKELIDEFNSKYAGRPVSTDARMLEVRIEAQMAMVEEKEDRYKQLDELIIQQKKELEKINSRLTGLAAQQ